MDNARQQLRKLMEKYLSLSDLEAICFDLDIGYETIDGNTLPAKAIALVTWTERNGRFPELHTALTKIRDNVEWPPLASLITGKEALPLSNLPVQAPFFGREEELEKIAEAIHPDTRTWGALIDGPGGMGKTALAIEAAYKAPADHFTRKLFLSAKVRELTPAGEQPLQDFMLPNFIAMITELGQALGGSNLSQLPPDSRAKEVQALLGGERALLVIDNVETFAEPERVRLYQFLGRLPAACKAIVTSRRRTDIDARIVRLDKLSLPAAQELMAALAEHKRPLARASEAARQALYESTGGNPLLLKWVVGQLGRDGSQCRTLAEALAFLNAAPKNNDPLEYIFGDLLDTFTPNETRVLATLTYFRQPAETEWVATVADLPLAATQLALENLTDRALLMADAGEAHFLLPELTAVFLRRRRPEVVAQMGERLVSHAVALALENGWQAYERFPTLEAAWPTLAAAMPRLLEGDNDRLQRVCDALDTFLNFSGHWDEWLGLSQAAEPKAEAAGDWDNAGWRAYRAGWIAVLRGDGAAVLGWTERCASHWQKAKAGAREQAIAIRLRGLGHRLMEEYEAAKAAYQEALDLDRTLGAESRNVASDLNSLAGVEQAQGEWAAAERDYREALRIAQKIDDQEGVATYSGNLAALALDQAQWEKAEGLAQQALAVAEKIGRQGSVAADCQWLAKALAQQGRQAEGLPYAQRAVAIFTQLRSPDLAAAQAILALCETGGGEAPCDGASLVSNE